MSFFAFGINHESAPVEVRDAFALDTEGQRSLYRSVALGDASELIVLSTCNRTECYFFGDEAEVDSITETIARLTGQPAWPKSCSFLLRDEEAICHVIRVAGGLRSMVLGDGQILSQIKDAYRLADDEERVGTVMHRLMHTAFRAAKRIAGETGMTTGTASVASAAVAMARSFLEDCCGCGLKGSRVLLLGAGQMARLALQVLHKGGLASLVVTNRTMQRAEELSARFGAGVVRWEDRYEAIATADVVLVATSSESPVIDAAQLATLDGRRHPLLVIDISSPRNVDPAVEHLQGYSVLDLDALNAWISQIEQRRRDDLPRAEEICEEMLAEYVAWMFHQLALQPGIQAIRDAFEAIRVREIERHHHRFSELDREELDVLTRSIMQKLLSLPIVRLKSVSPESIDFVRGIRLLEFLFSRPNCDDSREEAKHTTNVALDLPGRWPTNASPATVPIPTGTDEPVLAPDLIRG